MTVIGEIFIVNKKLAITTGIPTKKEKAEIETHPVTAEARISKCSVYSKILQKFLCCSLCNLFWFILQLTLFSLGFLGLLGPGGINLRPLCNFLSTGYFFIKLGMDIVNVKREQLVIFFVYVNIFCWRHQKVQFWPNLVNCQILIKLF